MGRLLTDSEMPCLTVDSVPRTLITDQRVTSVSEVQFDRLPLADSEFRVFKYSAELGVVENQFWEERTESTQF